MYAGTARGVFASTDGGSTWFPLPAGFPATVGPFNVFDARVFVSQSIVDLRALNNARVESHNIEAARYSSKSARDVVVRCPPRHSPVRGRDHGRRRGCFP